MSERLRPAPSVSPVDRAVLSAVAVFLVVYLADAWRQPPRPDPLDTRAVLETYLGGTPEQVPERYAAASPVTYLSPQAPPTLLVYARRDHIVEVRFARRLEAQLHEIRVPAFAVHTELNGPETVDLTPFVREDLLLNLPAHPHCDRDGDRVCKAKQVKTEEQDARRKSDWSALDKLKLRK